MTLQDEQVDIDAEIVRELVGCTPDTWNEVILDVERVPEGDDREGLRHAIGSPEGHVELAQPSVELMVATRKLSLLLRRHGHRWRKLRYHARLAPDGDWTYRADFQYE